MLAFLAITVLLPFLASCAKDPTTVCLPDKLQFATFNLNTDVAGVGVIDFTKKIMAMSNPNSTIVQDLAARKIYFKDGKGNCRSIPMPADDVLPQCLPANAVYLGDAAWGFGPNALTEEAWEIPFNGGIMRLLLTNQPGQPRYVMLSKTIDAQGHAETSIYLNPTETITQTNLLTIPDPCPPPTAV
ncbi:unnamed protein product [Lymnaea stagnalis]|uniref:Lipoprotein n=1 Tax=Lymnaea stagnalis TaxID=6523 RepID=A0AAV2IET6_LYMST